MEDRIRVAKPASVEDYNAMGREVTDDEVAAAEDAAANWAPPRD